MGNSRLFGTCLSIGLVTVLSGCLGNGGAGGGAAGGAGDFEAAFNAASQRAPTSDMPTSLQGNYKGQMKVGANSGASDLLGPDVNIQDVEIIGDVDLNVAWTDGMTGNPFTGTASNFIGTVAGTTNSAPIEGTLTVDTSLPGSIMRTHTPSQTIMGQTIPDLDTGAALVHMTGRMGTGDQQGDVTLQLGGAFFGPGGNAIVGPVVGGVKGVNSTNPALYDAGLGGTYYAVKQ